MHYIPHDTCIICNVASDLDRDVPPPDDDGGLGYDFFFKQRKDLRNQPPEEHLSVDVSHTKITTSVILTLGFCHKF